MVKLIKLNSQSVDELHNKAHFTCHFQEDINVKPNSKIALRNIQFSMPNIDEIDPNMGLYISLKNNADGSLNNKQILIPPGEYIHGQLGDVLYRAINSAFLQSDCPLIRTGIYNRVMFDITYSAVNQFELSFAFVEDYYNTNLTTNQYISYNDTTLAYNKTGNNDQWDFISSGNIPICLGTGTNRFEVEFPQGFCVAVHNSANKNTISFDNLEFKIFTDNTSLYYQWQVLNNPPVITNIIVALNDIVELAIEEGHFVFKLARAGTNVPISTGISRLINYMDGTDKVNYYCYYGLKYLASEISDIRWTQNPYYKSNENGIFKTKVEHVVQSSLSDAVPSDVVITFFGENRYNDRTYQMLGFRNISYTINGVSGTFTGELATTDNRLPDGFYITVDNIRLNSYDYNPLQKTGRRKNILANITSFDFSSTYNLVKYETDYPIYIDIDNKDTFTFNTITISIYGQDNQLLEIGEIDEELILIEPENRTPIKMTILIDG